MSDEAISRPCVELADILRLYGNQYRAKHRLPLHHHRVLNDIERCRTAALGGHIDQCDNCGASRISYNSCRNRHCPKCQHSKMVEWVNARKSELLPIRYFHVVFTLPDEISRLAQFNDELVYVLLFKTVSETLLEFGRTHLHGEIGITAVLHTWGQTLNRHVHLHCIVTGGALSQAGQWKSSHNGFLFPVKAMALVFRAKYGEALLKAFTAGKIVFPDYGVGLLSRAEFAKTLAKLKQKKWVVYSKMPFAGADQVIEYIGRYTHRVAISNRRLLQVANGRVTFAYKDYRAGNQKKSMTLSAEEFIRRFLMHVLPEGFVRIRYYGLMANGRKQDRIARCREVIGEALPAETESEAPEIEVWRCAQCRAGRMMIRSYFDEGAGPPEAKTVAA